MHPRATENKHTKLNTKRITTWKHEIHRGYAQASKNAQNYPRVHKADRGYTKAEN